MAEQHRAAISPDEVGQTPLSKLTADQFLQRLSHQDVGDRTPVVGEKKKYELWVEENSGRLTVRDFLDRMRREKKKVELIFLEKGPDIEHLALKRVIEDRPDPRSGLIDPIMFE